MKAIHRCAALSAATLAAVTAVALTSSASAAVAGGDYGPDTCLDGYVWRGATAADHVCVNSAVRAQTAQDNALAGSRRNPDGGQWGPDSCLDGFVWREAVAGDHVCVAPSTRDQAGTDNATATQRRNELRTAIRTWWPNPVSCSGGVCTTTNDDAPRYRVLADRLNLGQALIILVRTDGTAPRQVWHRYVSAAANPNGPGGYLSYRTDWLQCGGAANGYFRVRDGSSGRWSARQPVSIGCATL